MNFEQYCNKHKAEPYIPNIIVEENKFQASISESISMANNDSWLVSRTR